MILLWIDWLTLPQAVPQQQQYAISVPAILDADYARLSLVFADACMMRSFVCSNMITHPDSIALCL